ncbi:short-chain dehydrogenase/reductase 2 [Clathrospora elynae]|uniref:Short-chain dehydrogenase/reductase 3 n=1 Tax=Clathrospora elynae TaxID=706981 RepID=A0A6A5SI21_9PLEO|nr:short-chain dehydrogenase/reductase 2 [Clathrospora elynae]
MPALVDLPLRGLALIAKCAFEPMVTGPLLGLLLYTPEQKWKNALEATSLSHIIDLRNLIRILGFLAAVGVIRKTNAALNAWATNNWQIHAGHGWNWLSEIAVVTGGCSGIGKAIAEALTSHGIRVAVLDVQDAPEAFTSNDLLTYFRCDISSPIAIAETADKIRSDLGHPSILVNNAGITGSHTILKTPSEFLSRIFDTNILSHWRLVQQFVPDMVAKNKGHIVTVASVNSFLTNSANADYVATKTAALAFHEGLTSELKIWYKAPGVKTTIAHPSWVRTPLIEEGILRSGQDPKILESMLMPEEVAGVIVRQITSRRGAQLFIPSAAAPISWLKGLPNWAQELVRDAFGKTSAVTSGSMIAY